MTDDEIQALAAQNAQDIAGLKQTLNSLIVEVIRPMAERSAEIQARSAEIQEQSRKNEERSVDNATLFRTLLAEAREDRKIAQERFDEQQKRFDAQQEAMNAILLQIAKMNQDIKDLGT